jgi:nucleotide-binding universal stress UspA family protein
LYKRILVPLDTSKLSECSLEHVKEIATGCRVSEVILLTVLEPAVPIYIGDGGRSQIERQIDQKERDHKQNKDNAELYLKKSKQKLEESGIAVESALIQREEDKSITDMILHYADNSNIDLIIMSTHGRSGISRLAFGSIADTVVRHSRIPILIVTPAGCRL